MKILLLANGRPTDGTGRLFAELAARMERRGHRVAVEFRSYPRGWATKIRKGLVAEIRALKKVAAADVLYVHSAASLSLLSIVAATVLRKKVICFVWDVYPQEIGPSDSIGTRILNCVFGWVERSALGLVDTIYVPTTDYLRCLSGGTLAKAAVYPLWPVDPVRDGHAELRKGVLVVAFAGQVNAIRGLVPAISSLRELPDPWEVRLHVFSRDSVGGELAAMLAETDRVELIEHGFISPDELALRLREVDLGLVSLDPAYRRPAFPSKILGYVTAGVPVLYSGPQMPALESTLRDFQIGLRVEELISDPDRIVEVARAFTTSRRRYLDQLTMRCDELDQAI